MTDPVSQSAAPVAPTPVATAAVSAPAVPAAVATPTPAPVVDAPAATVESTPEVTALGGPAVEAAPEAPATEVVTEAPKTEAPAEAPKPTEEAKAPETKPVDVPLPTYEPLTVPEGFNLIPEKVAEVDSMFANFEKVSGGSHEEVAKFRQAMVDYHAASVKEIHAAYQKGWEAKREEWKQQFEKDPEIGGNRKDTTIKAANQLIRSHGGSIEQQTALRKAFDETGVGNHPEIIRFLANLSLAKSEGKPLPAAAPAPAKMGKLSKMYGKKK